MTQRSGIGDGREAQERGAIYMCVCVCLYIYVCIYIYMYVYTYVCVYTHTHTHCGSDGKGFACNVGDPGLIPGLGRSPGEGNDYPLQYSCLENPMDSGAWRVTVHGVSKT